MLSKYGNCSRQLKIKNKLKIGCRVFTNKVGENSRYFVGVFNKTIIPLALVGYEMIIANPYPTSASGIINCFIKNAHKISRILPNVICKNN